MNMIITQSSEYYPLLPMRDIVVFPHMVTPFFIGREKSIQALEKSLVTNRKVFVVSQKEPSIETPTEDDLYTIGTIGKILQVMRLPNGTIKTMFEAQERASIVSIKMENNLYSAQIEILPSNETINEEISHLIKAVEKEIEPYLKQISRNVENIDVFNKAKESPGKLADLIAPLLPISLIEKQEILEIIDTQERLEVVYSYMLQEEQFKKLRQKIKNRVQGQINKNQKEYFLHEQIKAINKELGYENDPQVEYKEYEEKMKAAHLSEQAQETVQKELKKLRMMPAMSSEANIVRNYIEWILDIPWISKTEDNYDLKNAQTILDEDHYGLDKVKERMIEFLAVMKNIGKLKGPIICLVGPPGVGKTSIARSVARAMNRNFVRMSLGGVRDESEIRGHRRTYLGSLPGKIIHSMKKAKTNNPLILMDELDKMTWSNMGDPAAALLEVLDPEQNNTFMDHYLEIEYDLSKVLFFCTANNPQDIPHPLKDRMEIINLSGYTELEKENIALKFLFPKQLKEHGLDPAKFVFSSDVVLYLIRHYTKEAGVRELERKISKICRKIVVQHLELSETPSETVEITEDQIQQYLGITKYDYGKKEEHNEIGIVTGLAWTSVGGEILTIEVSVMKGKGKIQLTGKLGDVMKESAHAAWTFVRANANNLGIYSSVFENTDLHLHVPEGATPKDGPSAGIAIATALVSSLTSIPVRKDVAMTGEITLRGKVLPIGGLKEKLIAAKRACLQTILIPEKNQKDLEDIPQEVTKNLDIQPHQSIFDVLKVALEHFPKPVKDEDLCQTANDDEKNPLQKTMGNIQTTCATPPHLA